MTQRTRRWRSCPGASFPAFSFRESLKILHDDLQEAIAALREHDVPTAVEVLEDISIRIADLLSTYEGALQAAGIELPYFKATPG